MQHSRLVAGIAAAALPLALLAGCSEAEPTPKFEDPTSEPSASESATPDEPVKPTPPAAMKGDDVAAAKAFIQYYFEVAAYAQNTGDVSRLKRLALPGCVACRGGVEAIEKIYNAGGTISEANYGVTVQGASPSRSSAEAEYWDATATIDAAPQSVKKSADAKVTHDKASTFELHLVAIRQAGKWQMADWESAQ